MLKLTNEDIQLMWNQQLTVLSFMRPNWILSSTLGLLIVIAVETLMHVALKDELTPILTSSGLVYGVYLLYAASLYAYLRNVQMKRQATNSRLLAWLYGMYSVCLLSMITLMLFRGSYAMLRAIGLDGWLFFFTIASFVATMIITIIFAPNIWKTNQAKLGLGTEQKLGLAVSTSILAFGVAMGQIFVRMAKFEIGLLAVGGALLIISFVMATICALGVYVFIVMALQGFNNMGTR